MSIVSFITARLPNGEVISLKELNRRELAAKAASEAQASSELARRTEAARQLSAKQAAIDAAASNPVESTPAPVESSAPMIPEVSEAQGLQAQQATSRRRRGGRPTLGLASLAPSVSRPTILGS